MNTITGGFNQMVPGAGLNGQNMPGKLGKVAFGDESFDEIYKIGLNGLKGSVSEPFKTAGMAEAEQGGIAGGVRSFIEQVDGKAKDAMKLRAAVMSGESSNLHQAMIASQESSVSFSLMLEMRNKLLETYQELMRLQV